VSEQVNRNTILQLSSLSSSTDPERQKATPRAVIVRKSCIKTKRRQKQTSVWSCK